MNILETPVIKGFIRMCTDGGKYRIVWGLENGARPTSELPSHLLSQSVKKVAANGAHRVIYHAHPTNVLVCQGNN